MNNKLKTIILIVVIGVMIISLIPIIYIAKYNVPSSDDYSYGANTYNAWNETKKVGEVLGAALEHVKTSYIEWQGTFSAIFVMTLEPGIFGESLYGITTIVLVLSFILSNIILFKVILIDYLKADKKTAILLALLFIFISIQFVPIPVQGFYWYNGSMFYTFFYSLMLLLIGLILKGIKENKERNILNTIFISILAATLGGGNYSTGLMFAVILVMILIYTFIKKNNFRKGLLICTIFYLISFIINVKAPGNNVRQSMNKAQEYNSIMSIIMSFRYGAKYVLSYSTIVSMLLFLSLTPTIYNIVKKMKYQFRYPLIVSLITFGIFCSQFTPQVYALNGGFAGRVLNIIYYSFYWLIIINLFYYLGWISKKNKQDKKIYTGIAITSLVLLTILNIYMGEDYTPLSIKATKSLVTGEARAYREEMEARLKLYRDTNIKDIEIERLTVKPELLYYSDIPYGIELNGTWEIEAIKEYYNKHTIKIKE